MINIFTNLWMSRVLRSGKWQSSVGKTFRDFVKLWLRRNPLLLIDGWKKRDGDVNVFWTACWQYIN